MTRFGVAVNVRLRDVVGVTLTRCRDCPPASGGPCSSAPNIVGFSVVKSSTLKRANVFNRLVTFKLNLVSSVHRSNMNGAWAK